jgi:hypothetical protein
MPASLKRRPVGGLRFFDGRSQPVDLRILERNLAGQIDSHYAAFANSSMRFALS